MEIVSMKCPECEGYDWTFDDSLGENVCDDCGLVQVVRPFEETSRLTSTYGHTKELGSLIIETNSNYTRNQMHRMKKHNVYASALSEADRRTITLCNMILSNYSVGSSIKSKVDVYLRSLKEEHLFRGCTVEQRAASLSFYILKESDIPMNIRTHSKYSMVESKYISRWAKRIARHFRKSYIFAQENPLRNATGIIDRLDNVPDGYRPDALSMIQFLERFYEEQNIRFSPNKIVAALWLAGRMGKHGVTQKQLVKSSGNTSSEIGIREQIREMKRFFGLSREELYGMSVSDFTNGAY
tara:strand:- start:1442 stop:2332 length:891 start_codon:yes stop_codon:yes gene_type:complete